MALPREFDREKTCQAACAKCAGGLHRFPGKLRYFRGVFRIMQGLILDQPVPVVDETGIGGNPGHRARPPAFSVFYVLSLPESTPWGTLRAVSRKRGLASNTPRVVFAMGASLPLSIASRSLQASTAPIPIVNLLRAVGSHLIVWHHLAFYGRFRTLPTSRPRPCSTGWSIMAGWQFRCSSC